MNNNIKQITELTEGDCTVITKYDNKIKEFTESYNEYFKCVFFTIPAHYEIIGYLQ